MNQTKHQKILVTGGGGFLGKAIVRLLVNRGHTVHSFSRQFYPELKALGVTQIQGDISDGAAVENAFKGVETVFHVAAKPGVWGDYSDYYRTNVIGTENVISACQKNYIPFLIHTSSPSVVFNGKDMEGVDETAPYPDEFHSAYSETKAIAEQAVIKASNEQLKTIILRPHLIWGPEDNHLVPRIVDRAEKLFIVGRRTTLADTVYIDNAALAHILASDKLQENPGLSGSVYFITQDNPIPVWDMINMILNAAGKPPVTRSLPFRVVWIIGLFLEVFYKCFNLKKEPPMTRFVAEELATSHWFNINAAKTDLGYLPDVSIEEGIKRLTAWFRENKVP